MLKCGIFSSRCYTMRPIQNFSFDNSDELFFNFCLFFLFLLKNFCVQAPCKTMAPASRDLQENDIDVYVRLDSLATIVKKVSLKNMIIEKNFVLDFNTVDYFFRGFKI